MKKYIPSIFLLTLFLPALGITLVNEYTRLNKNQKYFLNQGGIAINSTEKRKDKCTWICHNNTNFCKQNHVKLAQPYFKQIDPIYFGIINSFKLTGNYGLANIIFLVILLPLLMIFLFIKSLLIQSEIRQLKNR